MTSCDHHHRHLAQAYFPDHFGHPVAECWSPKGWLPWEPQIWGEGRFDTEAEAGAQAKILRDEAKAQIEASS